MSQGRWRRGTGLGIFTPLYASQFAGWLGDTVILGSNGQPTIGNDDYCEALDAENVYRLIYCGYTFEEAISYYYSNLTEYRNRAFEFKKFHSYDYVEECVFANIVIIENDEVRHPTWEELRTLYADTYNFLYSLMDGLGSISDTYSQS